jgi:hypothetical protein
MLRHEIEEFWTWFDGIQKKVGDDIHNPEFLGHIDATVSDWGLGWEVGPGSTKSYSLTISPNGDFSQVDIVQAIIKLAPAFDNWDVFAFKQPKENWHLLILDHSINLDCSKWTYRLVSYPDNGFELEVKADNLLPYSIDTKELIADLIITNLLGEEVKMNSINDIIIVDDFDSTFGVTNIEHLPAHLLKQKNYS